MEMRRCLALATIATHDGRSPRLVRCESIFVQRSDPVAHRRRRILDRGHLDQHLEDFTVSLKDIAGQIHSDGMTPEIFRGQLATLEWHETLRKKVGAYSDIAGINVFDAGGTLINSSEVWPVPDVKIDDRGFFRAFKSGTAATPVLVELARGRIAGGWATRIAAKE